MWNDHAHGIAWMWQNHLDWKTRCRAPWKTVQCYWNNTTWRANEREFTLEQNSFLVLNKITFRSMGNQKGSWWRTSGKPWCQNWLNAFIACWILRANVDEISSSIRYACTSIIMGERYIFNDASSWLTENYFFFLFCTIFIVLLFLGTSTKRSYLIKKECWIKVHYFCTLLWHSSLLIWDQKSADAFISLYIFVVN